MQNENMINGKLEALQMDDRPRETARQVDPRLADEEYEAVIRIWEDDGGNNLD